MLIISGIRSDCRFVFTLFFVSFVQTSPNIVRRLVVCRFLAVFVACEPFLLLGGVLYWICCLNGCDRLKLRFWLLWWCVNVESPTQEFRIGLCGFVRLGLVTLVDSFLSEFSRDFQHVWGFWRNNMVLLCLVQASLLLLLHVVGFGLQERVQSL